MGLSRAKPLLGLAALLVLTGGAPGERRLTFHARVEAQRAIERVYHSHQIEAQGSFEEAVPAQLLRTKVRTYLKQSAALERFWGAPITAEDLRAEWERIATGSLMPERLEELYSALGHDPYVIQECLVRPVLADRLARERFESSVQRHGAATWDEWWSSVETTLDPDTVESVAAGSGLPGSAVSSSGQPLTGDCASGSWASTILSQPGPLSARIRHTAVWTGNEMIIWGGYPETDTGARYNPALDSWTPTSLAGAPAARSYHTAVWTGSLMLVWGGFAAGGIQLGAGGRYDPVSDTWTPMAVLDVAQSPGTHEALWTGTMMLVWSNSYAGCYGSRYNPVTNIWSEVSFDPSLVCRPGSFSMVWSGTEAIIWYQGVREGARYNPISDSWTPIAFSSSTPPLRYGARLVWDGSRALLLGGWVDSYCSPCGSLNRNYLPAAQYDPATDAWTASAVRIFREGFSALWNGNQVLIWGGYRCNGLFCTTWWSLDDGDFYDPDADQLIFIPSTGAPAPRGDHTAVLAGSRMLVWGGQQIGAPPPTPRLDTGGSFALSSQPDDDQDGFGLACDCDDANAAVYPGAPQVCGDGLNNDCTAPGWPALAGTNETDDDLDSVSECQGDCDDTTSATYPGAAQVCDGLNNNCDGPTWPAISPAEKDADADGFLVCDHDCDDADASVYPGAPQLCDGINNDCDDNQWPRVSGEDDADADGYRGCAEDCDETRGTVYPGAPQICDGINNDCLSPEWPATTGTNDQDDDLDGVTECAGDCNDAEPSVRPGAVEVCDGLDNNCSGRADEPFDLDVDGFATCLGDCDDARAAVYPGAPQLCGDLRNNDCLHDTWPLLAGTNEGDDDGDAQTECGGDCHDAAANIYAGAPQYCDGLNTDCLDPSYPGTPNGELDSDGDGYRRCAGVLPLDCLDVNPNAWTRPGDVQDLVWVSDIQFRWGYPDPPGGNPPFRYSSVRSSSPSDFMTDLFCPTSGSFLALAEDEEIPAEGAVFYYLVRAGTGCGDGPWGYDSSGAQHPVGTCP